MQGVAVLVLVFMWCTQTVHAQEGQWTPNYIPLVATKVWGSGQSEGFKGWLTQRALAITCTQEHNAMSIVLYKYTSSCLSVGKQKVKSSCHTS